MRFQTPLVQAVLVRRYKRFLADIRLEGGREAVAHCPNPGAMTGLAAPGDRILVEPVTGPARKLPFAWRLVELPDGHLACIDTTAANRVVREALEAWAAEGLGGYERVRPEQGFGDGSRIDFLLQAPGRRDAYLEVKSVTLSRGLGLAEFPDAVTARGTRHLGALAAVASTGRRAVLFYLVQRTDCDRVTLAADIDPGYAHAAAEARRAGVEMRAHAARITAEGITLGPALDIVMPQ